MPKHPPSSDDPDDGLIDPPAEPKAFSDLALYGRVILNALNIEGPIAFRFEGNGGMEVTFRSPEQRFSVERLMLPIAPDLQAAAQVLRQALSMYRNPSGIINPDGQVFACDYNSATPFIALGESAVDPNRSLKVSKATLFVWHIATMLRQATDPLLRLIAAISSVMLLFITGGILYLWFFYIIPRFASAIIGMSPVLTPIPVYVYAVISNLVFLWAGVLETSRFVRGLAAVMLGIEAAIQSLYSISLLPPNLGMNDAITTVVTSVVMSIGPEMGLIVFFPAAYRLAPCSVLLLLDMALLFVDAISYLVRHGRNEVESRRREWRSPSPIDYIDENGVAHGIDGR
jgi:hypothetical protein